MANDPVGETCYKSTSHKFLEEIEASFKAWGRVATDEISRSTCFAWMDLNHNKLKTYSKSSSGAEKWRECIIQKNPNILIHFKIPQRCFFFSSEVFLYHVTVLCKGPMKANRKPTKARELSVFSPPDKFEIFFQLFFGGLTLRIETVAIIKWN